ncbi:MAG: hypothetical protein WCH61_10280, partial [bacterium]
ENRVAFERASNKVGAGHPRRLAAPARLEPGTDLHENPDTAAQDAVMTGQALFIVWYYLILAQY